MEPEKIIARFRDGRVARGHLVRLSPTESHLVVTEADKGGPETRIPLSELKAIFFVRSFSGSGKHQPGEKASSVDYVGRKVGVRFADGEVVTGYARGFDTTQKGFFLYPIEANSNNRKIFVVRDAVEEVKTLDRESGGAEWLSE